MAYFIYLAIYLNAQRTKCQAKVEKLCRKMSSNVWIMISFKNRLIMLLIFCLIMAWKVSDLIFAEFNIY